ncbi:hypothetical protein BD309DRAFT_161520 [Dichomitus squalens]|nr:hypothetical protein BD309DRAFT_161520 [Dichomitus squalens]
MKRVRDLLQYERDVPICQLDACAIGHPPIISRPRASESGDGSAGKLTSTFVHKMTSSSVDKSTIVDVDRMSTGTSLRPSEIARDGRLRSMFRCCESREADRFRLTPLVSIPGVKVF